jgi:hypothetical protein
MIECPLISNGQLLSAMSQDYNDKLLNIDKKSVSLSSEDSIIFGLKDILDAAITLVEHAASQRTKNNQTIYLTYYNELDLTDQSFNDLIQRFVNALLKAADNGWNVFMLTRFGNNTQRTIRFINFIKPLLKTEKFYLYQIKEQYSVKGAEIVVVPNRALSCFSTIPFRNRPALFILKIILPFRFLQAITKYCLKLPPFLSSNISGEIITANTANF